MYLILQEKINEAIKEIKSEKYLNEVASTSKFCHHGSNIIHYFEDNDLMEEFVNTKQKKEILKKYIEEKLNKIKKDLLNELKSEKLYRAILLEKEPNKIGYFGIFWSSNKKTAACVQNNSNLNEYLLEIDINYNDINFIETIKSRLDVIHGEREFEIQLNKDSVVSLKKIEVIKKDLCFKNKFKN